MLSVLIPTYNQSVALLVAELHRQLQEAHVEFEILVMEDGSTQWVDSNAAIKEFSCCRHLILPTNVGRSAVRNRLAEAAVYTHLLFIDSDSLIPHSDYIDKYLSFFKEEAVVLGGRIYDDKEVTLHSSLPFQYGKMRERNGLSTQKRRNAYPMFTSPNFLIRRSIFNKVRFDESIQGYGHEDTVFGIALRALNYPILFIDNPVLHKGIDTNEEFLTKNKEAIQNLFTLYCSGRYLTLANESKLLHLYTKVAKLKLNHALAFFLQFIEPYLVKKLCVPCPSLVLFDFYKLCYLCMVSLKK